MKKFRIQNSEFRIEGGQTLIEVLLAFAVAVIIILAITSMVVVALENAEFKKNQKLAEAYAQEGMEIMKDIRDRSWADFYSYNSGPGAAQYFLAENSTTLVGPLFPWWTCPPGCPNVAGSFVRTVEILREFSDCEPPFAAQKSRVHVIVRWKDNRCGSTIEYCHWAIVTSCFTNINNPVPTP